MARVMSLEWCRADEVLYIAMHGLYWLQAGWVADELTADGERKLNTSREGS